MRGSKPRMPHKGKSITHLIILLLLFVCTAFCATAQTEVKPTNPPLHLTVLADKTVAPSDTVTWEFGAIDLLASGAIEHTFLLRNDSKAPVVIDRVQTSCGCTSALLGHDNAVHPTLAPGQAVDLRLRLDPARLPLGSFNKAVWVYVQGQPQPAATLFLSGKMRPLASFSVPILDFGRLPAGQSRALSMQLTLDSRTLIAGHLPRPICSDPDLQFALTDRQAHPPTDGAPGTIVLSYRVTLPAEARLGQIYGRITLVPAPSSSSALKSALSVVLLQVAGQVIGDIAATPGTVVFGAVAQGQPARLQTALTAVAPSVLQSLKVTSSVEWLSARVIETPRGTVHSVTDPAFGSRPVGAQLEVTLSEHAPVGMLTGEVTLFTTKGQRLVIPVLVYVSAPTTPATRHV